MFVDAKEFHESFPGRLIKIPEGVCAFVPDPLPPSGLKIENMVNSVSRADHAIGELKGVGANLPNPHLVIGPLQNREAIRSSALEETIATAQELVLFHAELDKAPPRNEIREVRNYIVAMEHGLDRLKTDLPISNRLIREVHKHLTTGVRGREKRPGEFRAIQNYIAAEGASITQARFVPPPVLDMNESLHDLELYLQPSQDIPALVRLALIHYQFEAIHPFMDGNGRMGRLLITLLLCSWGLLTEPLLYMSSYFEKHRTRYKDLLLAVSQTGSWEEWIGFFLDGIVDQSEDAIKRATMLLNLKDRYRTELQQKQSSNLPLRLIDELFLAPWTTMRRASQVLRATPRTAQLNIDKLVAAGILREATGRKRSRIYIAPGILEIIEKDSFD